MDTNTTPQTFTKGDRVEVLIGANRRVRGTGTVRGTDSLTGQVRVLADPGGPMRGSQGRVAGQPPRGEVLVRPANVRRLVAS